MNYRNHIALNLATAHPHYDDEGNTYNMGTAIMGLGRPKYVIFKVPPHSAGMTFTAKKSLSRNNEIKKVRKFGKERVFNVESQHEK